MIIPQNFRQTPQGQQKCLCNTDYTFYVNINYGGFMVYCWNCGEKNHDYAKYCIKCGKPLIHEDDIEKILKKEKETPTKDSHTKFKDIKLTGDNIENLEKLTTENLQKDMNTLKECNSKILQIAKKLNGTKIKEEDFNTMMEKLITDIRSELKALNKKLICISPAVMIVTISSHGYNPRNVTVKTDIDKEKMEDYMNMFRTKKMKSLPSTPQNIEGASWTEHCPVCKRGPLNPYTEKKLMGLVTRNGYRCSECGAVFIRKGDKYSLEKVSNTENDTWKIYARQALSEREWTRIAHGGMSDALQKKHDLKKWLADAASGKINFKEPESPIILKKDEKAVLVLDEVTFWEPRAVRQTRGLYGGPTIRVAKGVSFRLGGVQAQSESHEKLKQIDKGILTLTTRRIIFTGEKRTINIDLRKILSIEAHNNGIASQRENKQKTEYFLNTNNTQINITVRGNHYTIPVTGEVLKSIIEGMIKQLQ